MPTALDAGVQTAGQAELHDVCGNTVDPQEPGGPGGNHLLWWPLLPADHDEEVV